MTFYEAALRILESEGRPLHFLEITEKSIAQNLLSHVGKTPEQTMLSRLAAMARRTRERKVVVTAKDTFALVEWSLPEDVEALAQTGVVEPNPEESLPPMRPEERHPEPRNENARSAGRGSDRKRRRDEEEEGRGGKRRRFPPIPEVAFEVLSEAEEPLRVEELIERARSRELAAEDLAMEALLTALLEDNQRRIDAGRRPQFSFSAETKQLALERGGAPSDVSPQELQAAFAAALGIPLEAGRPVLPGKAAPAAAGAEELATDPALMLAARTALKDARRAVARSLRKRLGELEVGTFEKSVVKMMHALGFRELKVAKRSKEGPLLTARKREGSVELRYAVRMVKGTPSIDRKAVQELRRDLNHYSAQVGLLACAGDVRGDAKSEAQASGSLVMLWCGDALGEKFLEAETAVTVTRVELFEVDERFFDSAKVEAEEAQRRREERQKERHAREDGAGEPRREAAERDADEEVSAAAPAARPEPARAARPAAAEAPAPGGEEDEGEEGEEGDDEEQDAASAGARPEGAEGAPGERKRRRRRRRGRRGRGNRPEGEPGAAGEGAAAAPAAAPAEGAPEVVPEGSPEGLGATPASAPAPAEPSGAPEAAASSAAGSETPAQAEPASGTAAPAAPEEAEPQRPATGEPAAEPVPPPPASPGEGGEGA